MTKLPLRLDLHFETTGAPVLAFELLECLISANERNTAV